jgi:hypothetical protein
MNVCDTGKLKVVRIVMGRRQGLNNTKYIVLCDKGVTAQLIYELMKKQTQMGRRDLVDSKMKERGGSGEN